MLLSKGYSMECWVDTRSPHVWTESRVREDASRVDCSNTAVVLVAFPGVLYKCAFFEKLWKTTQWSTTSSVPDSMRTGIKADALGEWGRNFGHSREIYTNLPILHSVSF